jgi:DMSO/TMAO reductase YedYZ heme-binding membrane subunit
MLLGPRARKTGLTVHVVASVGWTGAVMCFLALSVVSLASQDPETVRSVFIAMESIGWLVLVPLSFASLVSGLVQALGTRWGLFRHYWVLIKLLANLFATVVLILYMQTLEHFAGIAQAQPVAVDFDVLRSPSPALHAGAALILLLVAVVLSIFKPRGLTKYGQRRLRDG